MYILIKNRTECPPGQSDIIFPQIIAVHYSIRFTIWN